MTGYGAVEAEIRRAGDTRGRSDAARPAPKHSPRMRAAAAGFTYIGLLLLIAMMGIALTRVSELWQTAQKREKEQELLYIGNQFRRALAMYSANGGGYPQRLEDLLKDPRTPGVRRYLRRIYRDPITGSAEWGLVKSGGNFITGVHSLSVEQPLKQTGFRPADREFEGKKKYSEWVFSFAPTQGTPAATAPGVPGAVAPADSRGAQSDPTLNGALSRVRR